MLPPPGPEPSLLMQYSVILSSLNQSMGDSEPPGKDKGTGDFVRHL